MIDQLLNDTPLIFIIAGVIFGLLGGVSIACLLLACYEPKAKRDQAPRINPIRLFKPRKQRRETLKRATKNARLMLAIGGSVDIPPQARRRA